MRSFPGETDFLLALRDAEGDVLFQLWSFSNVSSTRISLWMFSRAAAGHKEEKNCKKKKSHKRETKQLKSDSILQKSTFILLCTGHWIWQLLSEVSTEAPHISLNKTPTVSGISCYPCSRRRLPGLPLMLAALTRVQAEVCLFEVVVWGDPQRSLNWNALTALMRTDEQN